MFFNKKGLEFYIIYVLSEKQLSKKLKLLETDINWELMCSELMQQENFAYFWIKTHMWGIISLLKHFWFSKLSIVITYRAMRPYSKAWSGANICSTRQWQRALFKLFIIGYRISWKFRWSSGSFFHEYRFEKSSLSYDFPHIFI